MWWWLWCDRRPHDEKQQCFSPHHLHLHSPLGLKANGRGDGAGAAAVRWRSTKIASHPSAGAGPAGAPPPPLRASPCRHRYRQECQEGWAPAAREAGSPTVLVVDVCAGRVPAASSARTGVSAPTTLQWGRCCCLAQLAGAPLRQGETQQLHRAAAPPCPTPGDVALQSAEVAHCVARRQTSGAGPQMMMVPSPQSSDDAVGGQPAQQLPLRQWGLGTRGQPCSQLPSRTCHLANHA